jgi:hypothetical protein
MVGSQEAQALEFRRAAAVQIQDGNTDGPFTAGTNERRPIVARDDLMPIAQGGANALLLLDKW